MILQNSMGEGDVIAKFQYILTFFFANFAYHVCKETLLDMCCLSSMIELNLLVSFLSIIIFWLMKSTYYTSIRSSLPLAQRIFIALLSVGSFITKSKSLAINSNSAHRLFQLLSIPITVIMSLYTQHFDVHEIASLTFFFIGCLMLSTDSYDFNPSGTAVGIFSSFLNSLLVISIQHISTKMGLGAIELQTSLSLPRLILSIILSIFLRVLPIVSWKTVFITLSPFPICLVLAVSALDLAKTVSMTSEITCDSAVSFIVVEQVSDVLLILIGHTLNPTRFTTFSEAILSFIGFLLILPGILLFLVIGDKGVTKPTDVEPFKNGAEEENIEIASDPSI